MDPRQAAIDAVKEVEESGEIPAYDDSCRI